jgi:hypothetical protein
MAKSPRLTFTKFSQRAADVGLQARHCSPIHWQLHGGERLVNVWPHTRRGLRFQADGQKSQAGTLADAIALAGPPEQLREQAAPWEPEIRRTGLIRWLWRLLW